MLPVTDSKPYFLYIEDDPEDVELLHHALKDTPFDFPVIHLENGEVACDFLESNAYYRLPEVIFLDVNMSRLDGRETLLCLKANKTIGKIPVVVLSTSSLESDMRYFSDFHVPYIVKPGDVHQYQEHLQETLKGLLAYEYDFYADRKKTDAA